jgi:RNase adapter protein RapZ
MNRKRVIIISGLSGSGKSSAARALEDEGFFVVDNLPPALLPQFLLLAEEGGGFTPDVAVVIDVRNRDFMNGLEATLQKVKDAGFSPEIHFFEAADEVLIRRYSETRRRHPLAKKEGVSEGIRLERQLLIGLKDLATVIIDSSWMTPHQLREKVVRIVRGDEGFSPLVVQLQSFGFRYGIPPGSDLVMDVRFLPNPHFNDELRPLTGLDRPVSDFVLSQSVCRDFLIHFHNMLGFLLPHYQQEGKSYLTISVGCTGGRHRSAAIVESMRPFFAGEGIALRVIHRDIEKG